MARVNSQGLIDDGSSNLGVDGNVSVGGTLQAPQHLYTAQTLAGSGSAVAISNPGFYFVPATGSIPGLIGAGVFTGTVPSPGLFPGATLALVDTLGAFNWLLSGTAYMNGKALFVKTSGSNPGVAGGTGYGGGQVTMSPSGSIIMMSDGFRWCIIGGSGSMALAGNNL